VLTLHQLEVFAAVVAASSFSAAARRLGLTQPAVSLQIRGLEEHFGQPLLDRSGRTVRLTQAGQQAYAYTTQILGALADMEATLRSASPVPAGRLHLGSSTTPGECLLPRLLGAFQARYPDVHLSVEVGDTAGVLERLAQRQYDVALVGGVGHTDRLEFVPFAADELVLIAPLGHPLAHGETVPPNELRHHAFVMREEGSGTRAAVDRALAQAGLPGLRPATVLGSGEAVKRAVAAGVGLAFVSGCSLGDDGPPSVVVVPLRGLSIRRQMYVATERARPPGRLSEAFRSWLLSAEAQAILASQPHLEATAVPRG